MIRYKRTQAISDLDESIRICTAAVLATPNSDPDRGRRLNTLALRLVDRFSRIGSVSDLEESISISYKAIEITPVTHPDRAGYLHSLELRLYDRFSYSGDIADLNEAIRLAREARAILNHDSRDWAGISSNLGLLLSCRFFHAGAMADLEESIHITNQALEATPNDHPDWPERCNNLGCRLGDRFLCTVRSTDLNEAIRVTRGALEATPKDDKGRDKRFNNLGVLLGFRFRTGGVMEDLNESICIMKEVVNSSSTDTLDRPSNLHNLGLQLGTRFSYMGVIEDINEAIRAAREAVKATPAGHTAWAIRLNSLGTQLGRRFYETGVPADFEESNECFYKALTSEKATVNARITAGRALLSTTDADVLQDPDQACFIAKTTVNLLPLLAPHSLTPADKQRNILNAGLLSQSLVPSSKQHNALDVVGLASDVAAIALRVGKGAEAAIMLLETGRAVLASTLQELRTELSGLRQEYPELAHSFSSLRDQLDSPTSGKNLQGAAGSSAVSASAQAGQRREASTEMTRLLDRIRDKHGFERFLLSPTESEIRNAAAHGPMVVLNVSTHQCDALIIEISGIRLLNLPLLTRDDIVTRSKTVRSLQTLSWMWDVAVQPVLILKDLGFTKTPAGTSWPHIWWIPITMPPFLAFLSACGTGQILDNRSVDEGIHLTSAFQLAGFRHVIGTLWEVDDEMCVDMASMTYEFMFHEGISDTSVSRGLHHATRALRDQWLNSQDFVSFAKGNRDSRLLGNKPLEMPAWVPYIHYGV
ncbi:hypothetical protein MANI_024556 [Metarhizium anisopliae]|nr:hypothetical protein MANI_024556 [Metarhizium anisopliae]